MQCVRWSLCWATKTNGRAAPRHTFESLAALRKAELYRRFRRTGRSWKALGIASTMLGLLSYIFFRTSPRQMQPSPAWCVVVGALTLGVLMLHDPEFAWNTSFRERINAQWAAALSALALGVGHLWRS